MSLLDLIEKLVKSFSKPKIPDSKPEVPDTPAPIHRPRPLKKVIDKIFSEKPKTKGRKK